LAADEKAAGAKVLLRDLKAPDLLRAKSRRKLLRLFAE
jgi:hypothetical protein